MQGSQINVQTTQPQDAPVIEKAKVPKMHQIQHRVQRLSEPPKRTGRRDCLRSIWANEPGCVLKQLKAESPMDRESGTMEMKAFVFGLRIFQLLEREVLDKYNEELSYKENTDINVPIIKSIFKKEFNLNLTDFQVKSFLPWKDEEENAGLELLFEIHTLSTFLLLDTDENGELSLQEFVFPKEILEYVMESVVEEENEQKINTRGLAMIDLDRDDKLSFAECQKFLHKVLKMMHEESPWGFLIRLLFLFSDTDKNDKLSLHESSTVFQLVYEIFQKFLLEEESQKMFDDKVLKIMSRKSVWDAFTSFWFLFADNDENDELSLQEVSSAKNIFVEDEGLKMRQQLEMMMRTYGFLFPSSNPFYQTKIVLSRHGLWSLFNESFVK